MKNAVPLCLLPITQNIITRVNWSRPAPVHSGDLFLSLRGSEAYAPATTRVLPFNGFAFAGNVAGATFQAMLIRKVHLIAQEFKQPRGAHKNAGRRITSLTRLSIDANMGSLINLEAYQFQTFLYGLHFNSSLTWSLAIFLSA